MLSSEHLGTLCHVDMSSTLHRWRLKDVGVGLAMSSRRCPLEAQGRWPMRSCTIHLRAQRSWEQSCSWGVFCKYVIWSGHMKSPRQSGRWNTLGHISWSRWRRGFSKRDEGTADDIKQRKRKRLLVPYKHGQLHKENNDQLTPAEI